MLKILKAIAALLNRSEEVQAPTGYTENGNKKWIQHGCFHREDGPAIEWANGRKEWWMKGKRHREDGPAVEDANGDKEWWLDGVEYTRRQWNFELFEQGKKGLKPMRDFCIPPLSKNKGERV